MTKTAANIKTKADAMRYLYNCGDTSASFVCNVVQTRHRNAGTRLRRLAKLHSAGMPIRFAQFSLDELYVDHRRLLWADLDGLGAKDPADDLRKLRRTSDQMFVRAS
jgi:hypothetical protein